MLLLFDKIVIDQRINFVMEVTVQVVYGIDYDTLLTYKKINLNFLKVLLLCLSEYNKYDLKMPSLVFGIYR